MVEMKTATDNTFVIVQYGMALMQQRDEVNAVTGKPLRYPGAWCFPGEHIEDGESAMDVVVRGCLEEYGLVISEADAWYLLTYEHDTDVDAVYVVRLRSDQQPTLHEGKAMEWKLLAGIEALALGFEQERILPELQKLLKL